jgi:hypothetical protein
VCIDDAHRATSCGRTVKSTNSMRVKSMAGKFDVIPGNEVNKISQLKQTIVAIIVDEKTRTGLVDGVVKGVSRDARY